MYRRKLRRFKIIPRLLVVCEGKLTEKIYIEGVRRQHEIPSNLIQLVPGAGTPKTLVDRAVELKKSNAKAHKSGSNERFDEVWCVFDRDSFTCIPDALQKAAAHGIKIAFSNPCFELFLLLHFCECNADLHRDKVREKLKQYLPNYDKSFDFRQVRPLYPVAERRTRVVNSRSLVQGQIQTPPYCSVPDLIDRITPDAKKLRRWIEGD